MKSDPNFCYEGRNYIPVFAPMFADMMDEMEAGEATLVCPPPIKKACTPTTFAYWLAINAMAYGMRKGAALADAEVAIRLDNRVMKNGQTY